MLVTEREGTLACVTQSDHGRVAGALAEQWGNATFETGDPREPLIGAATHHDDGWRALDDVPALNLDAMRPAHFLEVPLPQTIAAYAGGVEEIYAADPHVGVLVSMHWAGLYSSRWGIQESPALEAPAARAAVRDQERRWHRAARDLWDFQGLRSDFEARLWHSYAVLQALDFLSLFLCLVDVEQSSERSTAPVMMPDTLRDTVQRPGARLLPSVPTRRGGEHVTLTLTVSAPRVVTVEPFPFAAAKVEVEIPLRRLPRVRYASAPAAADAYRSAVVSPLPCTLVGPAPDGRA